MQKAVLVILAIIFIPGILLAYDEPDMLNIKNPTSLKQGQMEIKIQHRFYGKINGKPLDNFFGLDIGANIGLGIRYVVLPKFEINSSYTRDGKECTIGASYTYFPSSIPIRSQYDFGFRIKTYGHHFDFLLGNNSAIGLRHFQLQ